jgi:uncharacterized membrane protein YjjP (DUF1212 family)
MQIYRNHLASSQVMTLVGGYLGSVLFILVLTAIGNLETILFGRGYQTKLFPEVIICLFLAVGACAFIHRVCTTTCLIFSLIALFYINRISSAKYAAQAAPVVPAPLRNKK